MPTRPIKVWDGTAWIDVGVTAPSTTGFALTANNLSDVSSPSTALSNLGGTPTTRTITAGTGLTGGGDLSANRTVSIAAGGVGTTELAASSVTAAKLAALPTTAYVSSVIQPTDATSTPTVTVNTSGIGGAYTLGSSAQNNYMEWPIYVGAGTYTLRVITRNAASSAILSISIDGAAALATTIDTYASSTTYNNITDITGIALTAGTHTVRFTGATKNASSTNYYITMQAFSLTRTGA